jgi:hypothetical protein
MTDVSSIIANEMRAGTLVTFDESQTTRRYLGRRPDGRDLF